MGLFREIKQNRLIRKSFLCLYRVPKLVVPEDCQLTTLDVNNYHSLVNPVTRVFHKLTKLAIMAILASEALLCEKNPAAKCYPCGNRTQAASDPKSNTILSSK